MMSGTSLRKPLQHYKYSGLIAPMVSNDKIMVGLLHARTLFRLV